MFSFIFKLVSIVKIYLNYLNQAFTEIYIYYSSPFPLYILSKKVALANRRIRILFCKKKRGRPSLTKEVVDLIIELKKLNPTWGAQRISDELRKIGRRVSKKTVLKYLEIYQLNIPPPNKGMKWSDFLNNHRFKIGIDFTSIISLMGKQIFIFSIIDLDTRKILGISSTYSPNAIWITQQFRNAFYRLDSYPSLCICDRDVIFSNWFSYMLKEYYGTTVKRTPIKSPWNNGVVERFNLSLKREVFNTITPVSIEQTNRVCRDYQNYFNEHRPHQGLEGSMPSFITQKRLENKVRFNKKFHLHGKIMTFEPVFS